MIGFYYKRKGLQKLFENVFGKIEIEKEKKECPLLSFRPEGQLLPRLAHSASAAASPALLPQPQQAGPAVRSRSRRALLLSISLPSRARV
jgi:hypothetical protein